MTCHWEQGQLLEWSREHSRNFPWRAGWQPTIRLLIGEMMLQRLRDDKVGMHYTRFATQFYEWAAIASAELTTLQWALPNSGIWRKRAISLNYLAQQIVNGLVVDIPTVESLKELPGFSLSVARWVRVVIFGEREPFLDGETARVIGRFYNINYPHWQFEQHPALVAAAYDIVDNRACIELNCALRDLADAVCLAAQPDCAACPLRSRCALWRDEHT